MKRHAALAELSRDHHHALVAASRLKRASARTAADAHDAFSSYWEADGREHFREEEEILLPACIEFINADEPIVAQVLVEHARIRNLVEKLRAAAGPELGLLHSLGTLLEQHVRREERELFPLIEQMLPDSELNRLVDRLGS